VRQIKNNEERGEGGHTTFALGAGSIIAPKIPETSILLSHSLQNRTGINHGKRFESIDSNLARMPVGWG
jgi:hypothetical protein